jgi:hypothetical protein
LAVIEGTQAICNIEQEPHEYHTTSPGEAVRDVTTNTTWGYATFEKFGNVASCTARGSYTIRQAMLWKPPKRYTVAPGNVWAPGDVAGSLSGAVSSRDIVGRPTTDFGPHNIRSPTSWQSPPARPLPPEGQNQQITSVPP